MELLEAPRSVKSIIWWAIARATSSDEHDAWMTSAVAIDAKPGTVIARGTITLGNGAKRSAERYYGSFEGGIFLGYRAPGRNGRWHVVTDEATAATFVEAAR